MNYFNLKFFLVFVCWRFFAVAPWVFLVMMLMARAMAMMAAMDSYLASDTTCRVRRINKVVQD